ncbi:MAG: AI-2E family transporter [Rhizobiaceae bacterium]|jgi:predicted PurR-regulated permease PerM|nr:AI-2E family transporter [Rhizobiaceae bacterium]
MSDTTKGPRGRKRAARLQRPEPMSPTELAVAEIVALEPGVIAETADEIETRRFTEKLRKQAIFWLGATLILIAFLYVFRSILLPFLAGMAIAYFLDPVADRLEKLGLSRLIATIIILSVFVALFVVGLAVIVPVLIGQAGNFIERMPATITRLQELIGTIDLGVLEPYVGEGGQGIRGSIESIVQQGAGVLTGLVQRVVASGMALINLAGLLVVTPVVAFYLLLDWDRMVAKVDHWIPRDHLDTVRGIFVDIDRAIAGFVRGQGTVCLVLGILYATALTVAGLNFGLLIGLFAGFVSFIPYVGSLSGLLLAMIVAAVQFWPDWTMIAAIAAIFFAGQFFEGNILQPKLVGESVGLHPVWLMFALFAFGALFGFVGLLIAVPAAAVVGVLVRFALSRYLASPLYHGHHD